MGCPLATCDLGHVARRQQQRQQRQHEEQEQAGCRLPFDALKCEMEAVTVNLRQRANKVSCRLFAFWFFICIPDRHMAEGYNRLIMSVKGSGRLHKVDIYLISDKRHLNRQV